MAADGRAHLQLPFARPLLVGLRRPWEKKGEPHAHPGPSLPGVPENGGEPADFRMSGPIRLTAPQTLTGTSTGTWMTSPEGTPGEWATTVSAPLSAGAAPPPRTASPPVRRGTRS